MKKTLLLSLIASLPMTAAHSQWMVVDDFNDPTATEASWLLAGPVDAYVEFFPVPGGDVDDYGLYVESLGYGGAFHDTHFMKELTGDLVVQPGETATFHMRIMMEGPSNSWHFSTSHVSPGQNAEGNPTRAWTHLNAIAKISWGEFFYRQADDGYFHAEPDPDFTYNQWYDMWIVVRNTFTQVDGDDVSNGNFTVYLQGPDDLEPIMLQNTGTNPISDAAAFRSRPTANGVSQPINWIHFSTNAQDGGTSFAGDIWLIDAVQMTKGEVIEQPGEAGPAPQWGGYNIDVSGFVYTGDWMGVLYVEEAPWVYSYNLGGWVYAVEPEDLESGTWVYVIK